MDEARLPPRPGTYVLWGSPRQAGPVRIGRLGVLHLRAGWYGYVGSALGPGGLRARLTHHLRSGARPRWHLDWLRPQVDWREIWYVADARRLEPQWVAALASLPQARVAMQGFGASDSPCDSHLFRLPARPSPVPFEAALRRAVPDHPPLVRLTEEASDA